MKTIERKTKSKNSGALLIKTKIDDNKNSLTSKRNYTKQIKY